MLPRGAIYADCNQVARDPGGPLLKASGSYNAKDQRSSQAPVGSDQRDAAKRAAVQKLRYINMISSSALLLLVPIIAELSR